MVIFKRLYLGILVGISYGSTELTTLWTIETATGNGITAHHIVLRYLIDEFCVSNGDIGSSFLGIPLHVLAESLFELQVANLITSCIVVQQTIEANAFDGGDEASGGCEWLQSATGANAECGVRPFLCGCYNRH